MHTRPPVLDRDLVHSLVGYRTITFLEYMESINRSDRQVRLAGVDAVDMGPNTYIRLHRRIQTKTLTVHTEYSLEPTEYIAPEDIGGMVSRLPRAQTITITVPVTRRTVDAIRLGLPRLQRSIETVEFTHIVVYTSS